VSSLIVRAGMGTGREQVGGGANQEGIGVRSRAPLRARPIASGRLGVEATFRPSVGVLDKPATEIDVLIRRLPPLAGDLGRR